MVINLAEHFEYDVHNKVTYLGMQCHDVGIYLLLCHQQS